MKISHRFLLTVFFLSACQSTSTDEGAADKPQWMPLKDGRFQARDVETSETPEVKDQSALTAAQDLEWDRVLVLSKAHLQKYPGNREALLLLSLAYSGLGDKNKSRFYAELVLKSQPGNALALNILGLIAKSDIRLPEDARQALVYFQLAQEAAPQNPVASLNAGYLNLEMGRFREAKADFKLASARCGDCVDARLGSALASQALGLYEEARLDVESVLAKDESNATARMILAAQAYYLRQEVKESQELLASILEGEGVESELQKEAHGLLGRLQSLAH